MSDAMPARAQIHLPDDQMAGTYADFVSAWHSDDVFVLDFAVITEPPQQQVGEGGEQFVGISTRVVSRVRIPPSQVFEIMKALEQQLSQWERQNTERRQADPGD